MKVKVLSLLMVAGLATSSLMADGGDAQQKQCPLRGYIACPFNKAKEHKKVASVVALVTLAVIAHKKCAWFKKNVSDRVLGAIGLNKETSEEAATEPVKRSPKQYRDLAKN